MFCCEYHLKCDNTTRIRRKVKRDFDNHTSLENTLTASILVAKVRKPPHVPKANAESHLGQHILDLRVPRRPVLGRCLRSLWTAQGCERTLRLALAEPGSLLNAAQWGFLSLAIEERKNDKRHIESRQHHYNILHEEVELINFLVRAT